MSKVRVERIEDLAGDFGFNVVDINKSVETSWKFLKPSATPPNTRDDNSPLQLGDTYPNSSEKVSYRYNGASWVLDSLFLGTYKSGILIVSRTQTIDYNGSLYQLRSSSVVPYTTTGVWTTESSKFKQVGDGDLRSDLSLDNGADMVGGVFRKVSSVAALRSVSKGTNDYVRVVRHSPGTDVLNSDYYLDPDDTTSVDDNGFTIVAADGGRWKLAFKGEVDIKVYGIKPNTDFTLAMNQAALAIYKRGGGVLRVSNDYTQTGQIAMMPHVTIKGNGSGTSPRITVSHNGQAYETTRPAGYVPQMCIDSHVTGLTLVGPGMGTTSSAFSIRNAMQCSVKLNEIALFGTGFLWNRGTTSSVLVQSYFNIIEQNIIKPCTRGHYFLGSANRNEIRTNSISDNDIAYDFGSELNLSETNTFTNENIEGCKSWAEWPSGTVYSQTWVGICIENPSYNNYVCTVKDPGRQVFLNLSLIPLGDNNAISMYQVNGAVPSKILGSDASSGTNRTGFIINEPLIMYDQVHFRSNHASTVYTGTVPANSSLAVNIPLPVAKINDRTIVSALKPINGCLVISYASDGFVTVDIINPTASPVTITGVEISVLTLRYE